MILRLWNVLFVNTFITREAEIAGSPMPPKISIYFLTTDTCKYENLLASKNQSYRFI